MSDFVAAEAAIRQLHARYVDAVWRKDPHGVAACFAEDGEWRVGGRIMRGPGEVASFMRGVFPQFNRLLMTFRTPILTVGNGVATGRTYVTEQSQFADGRAFGPMGLYFERFVEQGERWLFQWRLFQTNCAGPPDFSGEFYDMPDYGPPPAMPPLDEPTIDRSGVGAQAG